MLNLKNHVPINIDRLGNYIAMCEDIIIMHLRCRDNGNVE